ncbi:hypothetical protein GCM10010358_14370 [Streptomyces minutiscleroticus]|uniref:Uncharacterized protein n=1 Tax=Streptomyces minutiscleroticus TaxID=68238 RepID=A0A918KGQ1_9ACTN|nr:hypothetical protein GCM10010358_14370 [Streptomyces minutiscleroticus]
MTDRDSDAVRACLEGGVGPDTPGADGLPLLCAAVAGCDHETVQAPVEGGAGSGFELPDGTTPLLRGVDPGSPAPADAVLGKEPRLRPAEADRERLLDLARHRYGTGAAEELRRRTGAPGPAVRRTVESGWLEARMPWYDRSQFRSYQLMALLFAAPPLLRGHPRAGDLAGVAADG